jgi:ATP-dependent helicase Lhr and Lhr-like helicase
MTAAATERLHPGLVHHIANTLGWTSLHPLQAQAIDPILDRHDVLLLAPTAGGKTEATLFPLLTAMETQAWQGLTVLYISPLRALLNNLEPRISGYCSWLGRRAARWHGDVGAAERRRILLDPPDLLLTTPESLEAMLISTRVDPHQLFGGLRAVVVDEVHAFLGDDRGWHLLAVLERLTHLAGRPLQRVGLSATVGNPAELLGWLQGGDADARPAMVVAPPGPASTSAEVTLDYVGNLDNAATVIAALHRGEKRLVFCDSRRQVEELSAALRDRNVETHLSHSSLAAEERRRAEQAFADSRDCVIVATSTLELGVDVGDLDRVIQIDAPSTVAGFLQRLGRTGRRPQTTRNCLFLATRRETLLLGAGLLRLWSQGQVEPVVLPPSPHHILAQQLLALVLQERRVGDRQWRGWWPRLPLVDRRADEILDHLVASGYLNVDDSMLFVGPQAERAFGRRNFMELTSVFTAEPAFTVHHGRTEIGTVHPLALVGRTSEPWVLLLAGRNWMVTDVDWKRRRCFVAPTGRPGRIRWQSGPVALGFQLCRAMREVVLGATPAGQLTERAESQLESVRAELEGLADPGATVVMRESTGDLRWWTWAGAGANTTLQAALRDVADPLQPVDNLALRLRPDATMSALHTAMTAASQRPLPTPDVTDEALQGLKFSIALPQPIAITALGARLADPQSAAIVLLERQRLVATPDTVR